MIKILFFLIGILILLAGGCSKHEEDDSFHQKEIYSNISQPVDTPTIFAPGIISTNLSERDATFSPDGTEFYYTLWTGSFGVILVTQENENGWSTPEITKFSRQYSNLESFINYDGSKLFFASNRPLIVNGQSKDYDIWYIERIESGWTEPINIGNPINSEANEYYPSSATNGNLYFTAKRDESFGGEDIWISKFENRKYLPPENLGEAINGKTDEFNAFISPDESYIIFSSWGREKSVGGGDLYISFKNDENKWQPAINLSEKINSPALDFCPYVTRDEKYFFFTSSRLSEDLISTEFKEYDSLKTLLNNTQNGQNDIYWMKSDIIFDLRNK